MTKGETFVVKAMASGRKAAQKLHEYLMNINEENHMSFYERYYTDNSYDRMLEDTDDKGCYLNRLLLVTSILHWLNKHIYVNS